MQPPKKIIAFLRWFCREDYIDEIEGDLIEIFKKESQDTPRLAKWKLAWQVVKYIRPEFLKPIKNYQPTSMGMYKNFLTIGWRNLLKRKSYSALNILGLALGIACCLLIFMYVSYQRSFDNYHSKGDRIYRVLHGETGEKNSTESYWVWSNAPVGPSLKENFPEIESVVQFSGRADILLTHGETTIQEEGIFFMDSTVFDVFSWKLLKGNPRTALAAPYSIVLTETAAKKYFGDEDPLGKTLKGSESPGRAQAGDYMVTGVMQDIPANSHFRFNMLLSLSTYRKSIPEIFTMWGYADFYTYFLVNEHFDRTQFEAKIPDFLKREIKNPESKYHIEIEPMKEMYLGTVAQRQPGETGSISNLYTFSIIGLFVLAIAVINFMNLSTARSMERSKEVGIRKSIGAHRINLVMQFLSESIVIVMMSAFVGIFLVAVASPAMSTITGSTIDWVSFATPENITSFIIIILITGIIAGSYPSFVLSSYNATTVLKGMGKSSKAGIYLRKSLVVFQFSLSIALIAGTIIVYFQMDHIVSKNMGFDKEQMLIIDYNYDEKVNRIRETLKTEIEAIPGILSTCFSRSVPGGYYPNAYTEIVTSDGTLKGAAQPVFQVGIDFINHYNLKLAAGRSYSRDYPSDTVGGLVINETAAKQFGYSNPADIIGKKYSQWGRSGEIIGVVKDFNFISLHRTIEPLTLPFEPYACRYLSVKVTPENLTNAIEQIRNKWTRLAPHRPFLYSFLDESFNQQYQKDFRFKNLFSIFSILAIFIACLGLLGLATYNTEARTKEIGVRKVLGASVNSIVALLSKEFITLIAIAMIVAVPVAWYSMNKWLDGFAYRVEIHWWIFILAGMSAIIVAFFTISFKALKAARENPASSLRSE